MMEKNYPIHSIEFRSLEGRLVVGVRVKSYGQPAIRYFYVGRKGELQ